MTLFKRIKEKLFKKKYAVGFLPPQYKNAELGNLCFGHSRGNYEIPRDEREAVFCNFLENNGFNEKGYRTRSFIQELPEDHSSYKNDVFCIRPYYWGNDEKIYNLPNFEYYPRGLTISWYKYPFRDAYSNRPFSVAELQRILITCENSMGVTNEIR